MGGGGLDGVGFENKEHPNLGFGWAVKNKTLANVIEVL